MTKFIKICVCTLAVMLTTSHNLAAQETTENLPETKYKFGIGGGAGFATGYGLSFRYVPKKFGGQVNFAPFKTNETSRYSVGLTLIYMLIESKVTSLYLYQANHYYYKSQLQYVYNPDFPLSEEQEWVKESYVNNGLGFGIEIVITKRIGLNLMAGYAAYKNFTQVNVTGEAALYFKF